MNKYFEDVGNQVSLFWRGNTNMEGVRLGRILYCWVEIGYNINLYFLIYINIEINMCIWVCMTLCIV